MNTNPFSCDGEATVGDEVVRIPKACGSCSLCEDYALAETDKPIAVLSCEGACLRGEISRQTANIVCHELMRESTVRICLGGAFTKNTGQRALVRNAQRIIALEGCPVHCASRMMTGVLPGVSIQIIRTDLLAQFDKKSFAIDAMTHAEVRSCAEHAARAVHATLKEELRNSRDRTAKVSRERGPRQP